MIFSRTYMLICIIVEMVCAISSLSIIGQLTNDMGSERERKSFVNFVTLYLLFALSNAACAWCNYAQMAGPGYLFSILNQIAICRAVYHWFLYIEAQINPRLLDRKVVLAAFNIPQIILFGLIATTPWTHLIFYYTSDGRYMWGTYHIAILIMSLAYLLVGSVHVMIRFRSAESISQKKRYLLLILFMLFPLVAGIIDLLVPHLPVMELMAFLGIVVVFINMQQGQIFEDNLTGLANRRRADAYLTDQMEKASASYIVTVLVGDVDNLKEVNDRYGHQEGDHALVLIAQVLRDVASAHGGLAARWGGDEYILIIGGEEGPAPQDVIAQIEEKLGRSERMAALSYPLRLSVGYTTCTDAKRSYEDLIVEADAAMYEVKRKRHSAD